MSGSVEMTAKELSERLGFDQLGANGFLWCLKRLGKAKVVSHRRAPSGRGRLAAVWSIEQPLEIVLPEQPLPRVPLHLRLPKKMLRQREAVLIA